jgi:hypothetical protein
MPTEEVGRSAWERITVNRTATSVLVRRRSKGDHGVWNEITVAEQRHGPVVSVIIELEFLINCRWW